jgi:hypothetical protein
MDIFALLRFLRTSAKGGERVAENVGPLREGERADKNEPFARDPHAPLRGGDSGDVCGCVSAFCRIVAAGLKQPRVEGKTYL